MHVNYQEAFVVSLWWFVEYRYTELCLCCQCAFLHSVNAQNVLMARNLTLLSFCVNSAAASCGPVADSAMSCHFTSQRSHPSHVLFRWCLANIWCSDYSLPPGSVSEALCFYSLRFVHSYGQLLLLVTQYLMKILNGFVKTDRDYSLAPSGDDLIRFWRSEVKVTAGHWGQEWGLERKREIGQRGEGGVLAEYCCFWNSLYSLSAKNVK